MAFLNTMNISASGMTAQRLRLQIASENITNIDTTRTESGGPYKRKMVVFEPMKQNSFKEILNNAKFKNASAQGGGVMVSKIIEDDRPFKSVYNPEHPDANEDGYVMCPNVNLLKETVDGMAATRAYDANITAFNAIKLMAGKALEIGK